MSDELTLAGLRCYGYHGVLPEERRTGQEFVVDLTLGMDTRAASRSDDLHDTADYGSLVSAVVACVERDPVDLIETLSQRIAEQCLLADRVEWVRVTVHKPDAPVEAELDDVALTITRKRGPDD